MRASKNELSTVMDTKEAVVKEAVWGEMHVEYSLFKSRMDVSPLLKGLPNDRDPCPHWGILLKACMHACTFISKLRGVPRGDVTLVFCILKLPLLEDFGAFKLCDIFESYLDEAAYFFFCPGYF